MATVYALFLCFTTLKHCNLVQSGFRTLPECEAYELRLTQDPKQEMLQRRGMKYECLEAQVPAWGPPQQR